MHKKPFSCLKFSVIITNFALFDSQAMCERTTRRCVNVLLSINFNGKKQSREGIKKLL